MKTEDFYKLGLAKGKETRYNYAKLAKKIEKAYGLEAEREYKRGFSVGLNQKITKNKRKVKHK